MPALVGPLFFWDVVRLARRGRGHALRFLYGAALLAALAVVYGGEFGTRYLLSLSGDSLWVSLEDQARFAHAFANSLFLVQNLAVLVLVPAYLSGAVAEEKEKKTLDLLFTTGLTDGEIVLGKMLGRLAHVGGVLLAGLPVLSLAQLWGGIDVTAVLANFAVTGLTLLSVGGVSLVCSCLANTTLSALVLSYGASALLGLGCLCPLGQGAFSPLAFPFALDNQFGNGKGPSAVEVVPIFAMIHGGIGLISVIFAVAVLRPTDPRPRRQDVPPLAEIQPRLPPRLALPSELDGVYRPSPPVGDAPLLWKEVLLGTGRQRPRLLDEVGAPAAVALLLAAIVWVALGLGALTSRDPPLGSVIVDAVRIFNALLRGFAAILLTMACAAVGFRAAGSVVRERARGTLDGLLALPVAWEAVLFAKWLGSVLRVRIVFSLVAAGLLFSLLTGVLHPLALPLALVTIAAHVAFIASLGTWLSLAARSIPRAHFLMAGLLLAYFLGGWLLWLAVGDPSPRGDEVTDPILLFLCPWVAWWASMFPLVGARPGDGRLGQVGVLAVSAGCYLLAAALLWRAAVRRLHGERGPAPLGPDRGAWTTLPGGR
jgi:ABC-type transport system involved in multi-copper enzyme maturation permease subunit